MLLTSKRLKPNGTFSMRKYPFSSAAVPVVVFQITTLAKGIGSLFLLSKTRPFTTPVCCAERQSGRNNNRIKANRIIVFMFFVSLAKVIKIADLSTGG